LEWLFNNHSEQGKIGRELFVRIGVNGVNDSKLGRQHYFEVQYNLEAIGRTDDPARFGSTSSPLVMHRFKLSQIEKAYGLSGHQRDGVGCYHCVKAGSDRRRPATNDLDGSFQS
jgi:hypothetical protein